LWKRFIMSDCLISSWRVFFYSRGFWETTGWHECMWKKQGGPVLHHKTSLPGMDRTFYACMAAWL
jgi:hypothetical protein